MVDLREDSPSLELGIRLRTVECREVEPAAAVTPHEPLRLVHVGASERCGSQPDQGDVAPVLLTGSESLPFEQTRVRRSERGMRLVDDDARRLLQPVVVALREDAGVQLRRGRYDNLVAVLDLSGLEVCCGVG